MTIGNHHLFKLQKANFTAELVTVMNNMAFCSLTNVVMPGVQY